jgi:hypothetical protein
MNYLAEVARIQTNFYMEMSPNSAGPTEIPPKQGCQVAAAIVCLL